METMGNKQAASGCLFGLAMGDAIAAIVEFTHSVRQIESDWGVGGPQAPIGDPALVSDDTQMTLAVGEALMRAPRPYAPASLEPELRATFVEWLQSPENNRYPGNTCLSACRGLKGGLAWQDATIPDSKGCGANMRVAPVGLLPVSPTERAAIAQFQAALTHGHPTALAASDLTAHAVALLATGAATPADIVPTLREYAREQRTVYHADWLGRLWERFAPNGSPQIFIAYGWDECAAILDRLDVALRSPDRATDPCLATGEGWIAEEAFATGLLCFLLYPDDPIAALRRATVTSGDSDSIACLTGAFAGAYLGLAAWPDDWRQRIEYRDRLETLGAYCDDWGNKEPTNERIERQQQE